MVSVSLQARWPFLNMKFSVKVVMNFQRFTALKNKAGKMDDYQRDGFRRAGIIYTDWMLKRFDKYSSGGGTWRPISQQRAAEKGNNKILVDTRTLRKKLQAAKRITPLKTRGISLGIGRWAGRHTPSGMSIKELVEIHQAGRGRLPKRPIVVTPPRAIKKKMKDEIFKGLKNSLKAAQGKK